MTERQVHSELGGEAHVQAFFAICFAAGRPSHRDALSESRSLPPTCPASLPECSGHAQSIIQGAYRQTDVPFAVGATIHARLSVKPVADV